MSTSTPTPTTTTNNNNAAATVKPRRMRVLSIQSQVVHGHVGNSAATFPLQLLGVDVDCLNVLSFSNHTGYPKFKGHFITPEQFEALAEGLKINRFTNGYQGVLSGFLGNAAMMDQVRKLVEETQAKPANEVDGSRREGGAGSHCAYICDPVCGDNGKLYVAEACVEAFRTSLLPLAAVATPNGFEASILSGVSITSLADAKQSANWFHTVPKVPLVVIKSFHDDERDPRQDHIFMLVSVASSFKTVVGSNSNGSPLVLSTPPRQWIITVPKLTGYFVGTGDVFAGLLVGHFRDATIIGRSCGGGAAPLADLYHATKNGAEVADDGGVLAEAFLSCVQRAAAGTLGVLENTRLQREEDQRMMISGGNSHEEEVDGTESFDKRELMIVHSQSEMLNPPLTKLSVEPV